MYIYIYCWLEHVINPNQYPIKFPCELPLTSTFLAISITPMIGGSELSHRLQLSLEDGIATTMA